jgi:phage major head subunit gpT-like protein
MAIPTATSYALFVSAGSTVIGNVYSDLSIPEVWKNYASVYPSGSEQEIHAWTGRLAKPRLWKGARVSVRAYPQTYTLVNMPYEHTLAMDQFTFDDDNYGVFFRQLADQAMEVRKLPEYWTRDLLENSGDQTGTRQLGTDGLTGFNTAHPVNIYASAQGTFSNDFTGGGQTINGILVGGTFGPTAVATLAEYMMTIKGEDNEPLGVMPDKVMVPPSLMLEAELVLKSTYFAPPSWGTISGQVGAADNPLKRFGIAPIVNPYLTINTRWYMMDTSRTVKPLIWQVRQEPVFTPRVNMADPLVFDTHHFAWGVYGRVAPGWGFPFLFARSSS